MNSLSKDFGTERNLLIINSFLIYLYFFDINFNAKLPFINIDYLSNEYTSFIFLLLNLYFIFRLVIEWIKSDKSSKNVIANKIDFITSLTIAIVAIISISYKLTSTFWIWEFPFLALCILLIIGEFTASTTAIYLQNTVYIRSKEEACRLGVSRIPTAVLGGLIFIPINIVILYFTYFIIDKYASADVRLHWYIIILIPFIIHTIGLVIYFIFPDKEMRKSLQKIFDMHDRSCQLIYEKDDKKDTDKCDLTRKMNDTEYEEILNQLKNGQDPNAPIAEGGWKLIIFGAAQGDYRLVELLLEYGADINSKNTMGRSALFFACKYGYEDIAQLLIENGANVNLDDTCFYEAPLIEATKNGHQSIVELLIKNNADITQKDSDNKTALQYAEENHYGEIAKNFRKIANKTLERNSLP